MNVKEFVRESLVNYQFDGLRNPEGECGCILDDLAPCDNMSETCLGGFKSNCAVCSDEECELYGYAKNNGFDFLMMSERCRQYESSSK